MSTTGSGGRVRIGIYVDPVAPISVVSANIKLARLMGADDIWLGDHTRAMLPASVWDPAFNPMARVVPNLDAYLDPTIVIARYARRRGPRIGTSVTDPFRRSAADMARAWMSLHHVTGGNAVLGIGAGERENTVPYGIDFDRPVARLDDLLGAVRAAWSSGADSVTHRGRFHDWHQATFALPPLRGSTPPIWVAAQGPRASTVAGRWGDGWINTHYGLDTWTAGAAAVIKGAESVGRDPETITRSLLVAGVIVSTSELLEQAVRQPVLVAAALALPASSWAKAGVVHPLGPDYGGPPDYEPELLTDEVMALATKMMTSDLFSVLMPCGSAEGVAAHLEEFVRRGVNHIIVINLAPAAGLRIGADSLREQRRLLGLLKRMRPGTFRAEMRP